MIIGLFALSVPSVFADELDLTDLKPQGQYTDRGYLIVTPSRLRISGLFEPGKTYTTSFNAVNIGGKPISFSLTVEPFGVKSGNYEAIYSEHTNRTKITDWITFPGGTEFTLEPQAGRSKCDDCMVEIVLRIRVPNDAVGGGQYAAIMVNVEPSKNEESSFNAVSRIALPLHTTVDGNVIYSGDIIQHSIAAFSFKPTIKTSTTIENAGNADFEASYHLLIEPFFGGEKAYEQTVEKIIYPETKRIFEHNWEDAPALGIFNVTQAITYINPSGITITDTFKRVTIICPLWLIVIVLAFIIALITSLVLRKKRRKLDKKSKKPSWEQPL